MDSPRSAELNTMKRLKPSQKGGCRSAKKIYTRPTGMCRDAPHHLIREMKTQNQTTIRYHLTSMRMSHFKKTGSKCWKECGEKCWKECGVFEYLMEITLMEQNGTVSEYLR